MRNEYKALNAFFGIRPAFNNPIKLGRSLTYFVKDELLKTEEEYKESLKSIDSRVYQVKVYKNPPGYSNYQMDGESFNSYVRIFLRTENNFDHVFHRFLKVD